jgi:hypothetical protein
MNHRIVLRRTLSLFLGAIMSSGMGTSFAFDIGNMMNPSKWMGGGRDRDRYDDGPWGGPGYGYGGPGYGYGGPGYGYGGPGYGYGGPGYGYGGPGYGYGGPGYGYGGPGYGYAAPGAYGAPAGQGVPPAPVGEAKQRELDALRERIRVLEGGEVH